MSEDAKKQFDAFDVVVTKKKSRKEGKYYHALTIKFDYGEEVITFDLDKISKISDMTDRQLNKLEIDKPKKVGTYILG